MNRKGKLRAWARQPMTHVTCAILAGAGTNWLTHNPALAGATAAFVALGGMFRSTIAGLLESSPAARSTRRTKKRPPATLLALTIALGTTVAACSPAQEAKLAQATTRTIQGLCRVDQTYQPVTVQIASAVVPLLGAAGGGATGVAAGTGAAIAVDQATLHPMIVQACQELGGQAVAAVPVPVAATPANTTPAATPKSGN